MRRLPTIRAGTKASAGSSVERHDEPETAEPLSTPDASLVDDWVLPKRPWKRWLSLLIAAVVLYLLIASLVANPNVHWHVVGDYLFDRAILSGVMVTITLTLGTMFFGSVLGLVIAIMALSSSTPLRAAAQSYIWLFRSVPPLVQIIFWYNLALFMPKIELGLPLLESPWLVLDTNALITPFVAALIGFSLNEAGYMAEIFRSGYMSVPRGQLEAARGLGMTDTQAFIKVIAPQALRIIIPPTANEAVTVLKGTAVVFAISVADLLTEAQIIYSTNFEVIALLIVVSLWYIAMATVLMAFQRYLEKHLSTS